MPPGPDPTSPFIPGLSGERLEAWRRAWLAMPTSEREALEQIPLEEQQAVIARGQRLYATLPLEELALLGEDQPSSIDGESFVCELESGEEGV
jgi:hypothetical protein